MGPADRDRETKAVRSSVQWRLNKDWSNTVVMAGNRNVPLGGTTPSEPLQLWDSTMFAFAAREVDPRKVMLMTYGVRLLATGEPPATRRDP